MDLLIVQLKAAIRRLLDAKGVRARVLDKVNRYGEIVIGIVIEKPAPPSMQLDALERREDAGDDAATATSSGAANREDVAT